MNSTDAYYFTFVHETPFIVSLVHFDNSGHC